MPESATETNGVGAVVQEVAVAPNMYGGSSLLLIAIAAVIAWAITQTGRSAVQSWVKAKKKPEPWWAGAALKATSILSGAACGLSIGNYVSDMDGWPFGFLLGACGGALCTFLVAIIKKQIKKRAGD